MDYRIIDKQDYDWLIKALKTQAQAKRDKDKKLETDAISEINDIVERMNELDFNNFDNEIDDYLDKNDSTRISNAEYVSMFTDEEYEPIRDRLHYGLITPQEFIDSLDQEFLYRQTK